MDHLCFSVLSLLYLCVRLFIYVVPPITTAVWSPADLLRLGCGV